jgi:hypothetical protein
LGDIRSHDLPTVSRTRYVHGGRGIDFTRLRDFYSWGAFVGQYPEFDRQLALSIKAIRAKGSVRGAAVRFRHRSKGPLDKAELRIVIEAFRSGVGAPKDCAVVMIHLELGPNQQSVARLKTGDVKKFEVEMVAQGRPRTHTRYHVSLPRVKKRKEYRETVVRPISNELGSLDRYKKKYALQVIKKMDKKRLLMKRRFC